MEPTGKEKTKARSQKWWKELRARKIQQVKARDPKKELRCELTGVLIKPESKANCHHRFPDQYESEDLDDYRILSPMAHGFVEWLSGIRKDRMPRKELMMAWLGEFLTVKERTVDKLTADISIRAEYNKALGSRMFFELHPELTGIWEEDREEWMAWLRTEKGGVNA